MPQFFVAPEDIRQDAFRIAGPEAFHAVKVLRLAAGAEVELFDGKGGRFKGVIDAVEPGGEVRGRVTATLKADDERPAARVHLYLGLLKASHWDDALDKGTQLGAASFTPILTPRTVVLLHEVERAKAKLERWGRVVTAAVKQCGRADIPEVREPAQFRDAIRAVKDKGLILLAWEGMKGRVAGATIRQALRAADAGRGKDSLEVHLFVGPEGGFSEDEVKLAEAEGAVLFALGPRTLRAETAAVAALSVAQYELGGL
jgi:16S rRNA (uracil1498-N3)-methyltransferase